MPLKLLHTADLHLGMAFNHRGYSEAVRQQLIEARYETLDRLVEMANSEQCTLLVIAGDLFHRPNIAATSITRTMGILRRFSGCVALLPGNHDFYEPEGPLWRTLRDEAFDGLILLSETRPYQLHDYGIDAALYPAPCDRKHSSSNRIDWISALSRRSETRHHIGIAHGSLQGISPDFADQYFPMTTAELTAVKLSHWCLGHTHVRYPDLPELGRQPFLISGTPEPDGFDCRHGGYAWLTTLEDNGDSHSRSLDTGQLRFRELQRQVNSTADLNALEQELVTGGEKTLVKLKLSGTLPEADYRTRANRIAALNEQLLYLECDDSDLSIEITPELIAKRYPDGSFPHRLLSRLAEQGGPEALQLAYRLVDEVKR